MGDGRRHELTESVRCPVHGFIRYSPAERELINHWTFQRLRNVRQLALTHLVYPGAMHTRFEHSLGVLDLTTRAFDTVARKHDHELHGELADIPELKHNTLGRARQTVRLLALLHDVGHTAFSHVGEFQTPGGGHEQVSIFVIEKLLAPLIDDLFFEGATSLLARCLKKSPETIFLRQFVVGEMDMDRTDYLRRDSLHCGVDYGRFDALRMIECLTIVNDPDSGRLHLALERGGEHTFEALILARYQMTTQVYYHKIRRIYDHYLRSWLDARFPDGYESSNQVLEFDDIGLLSEISTDANSENERTQIARRIVRRNHHREIFHTGDNADVMDLRKARRLQQALQADFPTIDLILDNATGSIHKLSVRGDQDESKVEDLYVLEKGGNKKLATELSDVLGKIPKKFRSVRIFADAQGDQLSSIRSRVGVLEGEI